MKAYYKKKKKKKKDFHEKTRHFIVAAPFVKEW